MSCGVFADMDLWLLAPGGGEQPVAATLRYTSAEPYTVTASFYPESSPDVEWVLARDLLRAGLHARAGEGDVQVRPADGRPYVLITLNCGDTATFRAGRSEIERFLAMTEGVVPTGTETVDVDAWLADAYAEDQGEGTDWFDA